MPLLEAQAQLINAIVCELGLYCLGIRQVAVHVRVAVGSAVEWIHEGYPVFLVQEHDSLLTKD